MRIAKQLLFGLLCFPLVIILSIGALLVGVALTGIYALIAVFHPVEAEWSA